MDTRDTTGGDRRKRQFGLRRGKATSPEDSSKTSSGSLEGAENLRSRLVVVAVSDSHPSPSEHHLEGVVVHAPPELQRFEKATLNNPNKLSPEELKGASWSPGGTIRRYDPDAYEEHGAGVQHVKSYPTNTALESALEKRESGSLKSSAEASGSARTYVEKKGHTAGGKRVRHTIDVDKVI